MSDKIYSFPRRTVFGKNASLKLASELPAGARLLIVLGKHASENEQVKAILDSLSGFEKILHVGIEPEPPLPVIDALVEEGRRNKVDAVVSIGGGSVMDAGKASAALIPLEGAVAEYFSGAKAIPGKGLFFAALPTTAGTGSESTNNAVLTDPETKEKKSLRHASMVADLAIIDPVLTWDCPASLSAASGLDAFVQAFESCTSPRASTLTKLLASEAAKKILLNLETVCRDGSNAGARSELAEGSMLSGLAFSQTGLGAVHGIAHPVGSLLHVPHGVACAILMKSVMEWNASVCEEEYARLAQYCTIGGTAEDFIARAGALASSLGISGNFRKWHLSEEHFPFIIAHCRSASMKQNPRPMSDEDVRILLAKLL